MASQLPDDFRCPISLEIMTDPVILTTGHTFDRPSIQRWLDAGHRTCPITNLAIPEQPSLIPNHALRSLISNYTFVSPTLNSQIDHHHQPSPTYSRPRPQPRELISSLTSRRSSIETKFDSLDQLNRLSKRHPSICRHLTDSGALSAVLRCINSPEPALQEKALSLLLNLSLDDDNKVGLGAEGAIGRVVAALESGSPDCRAIAATILTSLAVVGVNKVTIGAYPDAIRNLVRIISYGECREVKEAATALYAICSFPDNRRRAVDCGAVPILFRIAELGLERAVEVLGVLAKSKEAREEIGRIDGCVGILVEVLKNGSARGVQCALWTLDLLCSYSELMCREAAGKGVLEICVSLVEDEDEKIGRIASSLVHTLSGKGLIW